MNPKKIEREQRKEYKKPELRQVQLRPEESLSAGCKSISMGGPEVGPPPCTGACFALGS